MDLNTKLGACLQNLNQDHTSAKKENDKERKDSRFFLTDFAKMLAARMKFARLNLLSVSSSFARFGFNFRRFRFDGSGAGRVTVEKVCLRF